MKKILCLLFLTVFLFQSQVSLAHLRLPAIIANNMVLQQQSRPLLWGRANPGEKVIVTTSWNNRIDSVVTNSNGIWKINVPTGVAGGPYTITLKGWNTIHLKNIMLGEVWLCSGQSNMEMSNTPQIKEESPKSRNENIRFFHIPRTTSDFPQDDCEGSWDICGPETLGNFSAVGYFFGKKLQQELNVPIGLIESAWGGTPAEVWTPAPVIAADPVMTQAASQLSVTPWGPHEPGKIYNAMIAPITSFEIAGTIWYQGESNTGIAESYQKTFTSMIGAWRKAWQKDFPFYYVQIAPYSYGKNFEGALLMEQQAKSESYPKTGMVVITDLVDNIRDIHPKNKLDVGLRLARLALDQTYDKNMPGAKSPRYGSMEINKSQVILHFDNAPNGLIVKDGSKATEFYIAGKEHIFFPADVKVDKDRVAVSSKQVPEPLAVRFAFSNTAMANLFSREGLPVCPFRTDDWEIKTGE